MCDASCSYWPWNQLLSFATKSPPHLAREKEAMCEVYLFHTFTFLCPARWHVGFAQPGSGLLVGCPNLVRMDQAAGRAKGVYILQSARPRRQKAPSALPRQLHGECKDILQFGLEGGGFHVQLKQKEMRFCVLPTAYYTPLNYTSSNKKK